MIDEPRCVVCAGNSSGTYAVSLHGELTCASHGAVTWCAVCSRPRPDHRSPGWDDLGARLSRCPTCAIGSVNTREDVRRALPVIRATAKDLGFSLTTPVRVALATDDELRERLPGPRSGTLFGVTELVDTGVRRADATIIRVLAGLPHDVFGSTTAHELGHAWLGQTGTRPHDHSVEEGLCELISYAWLKKVGTPFAEALRTRIADNPDPVYGDGFRLVHNAVRAHGVVEVLTHLAATGALPTHSRRRTGR